MKSTAFLAVVLLLVENTTNKLGVLALPVGNQTPAFDSVRKATPHLPPVARAEAVETPEKWIIWWKRFYEKRGDQGDCLTCARSSEGDELERNVNGKWFTVKSRSLEPHDGRDITSLPRGQHGSLDRRYNLKIDTGIVSSNSGQGGPNKKVRRLKHVWIPDRSNTESVPEWGKRVRRNLEWWLRSVLVPKTDDVQGKRAALASSTDEFPRDAKKVKRADNPVATTDMQRANRLPLDDYQRRDVQNEKSKRIWPPALKTPASSDSTSWDKRTAKSTSWDNKRVATEDGKGSKVKRVFVHWSSIPQGETSNVAGGSKKREAVEAGTNWDGKVKRIWPPALTAPPKSDGTGSNKRTAKGTAWDNKRDAVEEGTHWDRKVKRIIWPPALTNFPTSGNTGSEKRSARSTTWDDKRSANSENAERAPVPGSTSWDNKRRTDDFQGKK